VDRKLKRTLVLGLGNPMAGDDSFGPMVIDELLQSSGGRVPGADLANAYTDLLAWIERFPRYFQVVLVDAILDPQCTPGEVVVFDEKRLAELPDSSPSVHQISPVLGVKLFRQLHGEATTRIKLLGLCTNEIRIGTSLLTRSAVVSAAAAVRQLIARC
jgi:hydrogenase maturation protease